MALAPYTNEYIMNKLFYVVFFCCLSLIYSSTYAQYQFTDSGFEDWSGATFDGNIQPKYWNYSNVEQLGVKKNFAHQAQGRTGNCLLIQDQFVGVGSIGATSPGYVALGQPWAYISSLTAINDATAGTYGGITWTHRPDSVAVWVKRVYDGSVDQAAGDHTADENFNIVYYAWTGTSFGGQYMAKNLTCTDISTIKPEYCTDEESDIRIATNGNECGVTTQATQVAEGWYREMNVYSDWTRIVVPIYYFNDNVPQKCNLILSAGNYPNFRANSGIYAGNSLYVDDVELIYTSKIQKLFINNREWKGFDPDNTTTEQVYSLGQGATNIPTIYAVRGAGSITNLKGNTTNFSGRRLSAQECTIQNGVVDGAATIITVQSEDGSSTTTYRIRFVSQASNNAKLADIMVNGASISGFNAYLSTYNIALPYGTTEVPTVTAAAQDAGATVQISQPTTVNGTATITVTAQDGTTVQTYTLQFSVAPLADVTLQNILIDGVSLPGFTPAKANYNVSLPLGTTTAPQVTPVSAYPQGAQTITMLKNSLSEGCQIQVSAPGAVAPKTYKLTYKVEASTYSYLSDIQLDNQSVEGFSAEEMVYYINLPLGTTSLPTISWTTGDPYQTVSLDTSAVQNLEGTALLTVTAASGAQSVYRLVFSLAKSEINELSMIYIDGVALTDFNANKLAYEIELPIGTTVLPSVTWDEGDEYQTVSYTSGGLGGVSRIIVRAQNGSTRIYQITFRVATSSDATLTMIYLDGEQLEGFDPQQLIYNINLPQGTATLPIVTYQAHDAFQTISTRPATSLNGEYKIIVKPQTGAAQTYVLRFSVATSSNNALQSILLDDEPMASFHPDTLNYIDTLPLGVSTIPTVTYVKAENTQKVQMLTNGTTVTLTVTAENGSKRVYTLQFIVQKSENAFLKLIRLGNDTLPGFDPKVLSYTITLPASAAAAPIISVEKNAGQQVVISQPTRLGTATITVTPEQGARNIYRIQFVEENVAVEPTFPDEPAQDTLSTNAALLGISLNGTPLAGFQPEQLNYAHIARLSGHSLPVVNVQKGDDYQSVTWSQIGADSIAIIVMAEAGNQQVYTLSFDYQPSADATLHTLLLDGSPLAGFSPAQTMYEVALPADAASLPAVTFSANEQAVIAVAEMADKQVIDVWAENGDHAQYIIAYRRAKHTSAQLSNILLDNEPLEGFNPATRLYEITLPWHVNELPLIGVQTAEPVASITLHCGLINDTTFIRVLAEDSLNTRTYKLLFISPLSNDTTLQSIEIDGALFDFDPATFDYHVTLPYGTTSVPEFIIEKSLQEQEVMIERNDLTDTTTVMVIAEDGSRATYRFTFTVTPSAKNNELRGIVVDGVGALDMTQGPNFTINLPYESPDFEVVNVTKNFPEQTVIIENGGLYKPTYIRVQSGREGDAEMVYTLQPNKATHDLATFTSVMVDGTAMADFNPDIYDYVLIATANTVPSIIPYPVDSNVVVSENARSNDKCIAYDVEYGNYLHTYRFWIYYPGDVTFDTDFETWESFTNNGTGKSGVYPSGWHTPLTAPTSGDKGTYYPQNTTVQSNTATSGASAASLNTIYLLTSAEAMPGFVSLSEPTVKVGAYKIFSHSASTLTFGNPITFRNSPDTIALDYQYQASNKVTGWRMQYIANGSAQVQFSEDFSTLTANEWRTVNKPIRYSNDFVPATLDIRISAAHTDNLSSFYVGANGAQEKHRWTASMLIDNLQLKYNSVLTGLLVNGAAATINGTTITATINSEFAGLPELQFTGEVTDQGRKVTWQNEVDGIRNAIIRNFAEDGSYTDYSLTVNRPKSAIDTCSYSLMGTDLLVKKGSPYQTIQVLKNDTAYFITCTSEKGTSRTYSLRYRTIAAAKHDTIAAVPFVSPIVRDTLDLTPPEVLNSSAQLAGFRISGTPMADFNELLTDYTIAPETGMRIEPVLAYPLQQVTFSRSEDTIFVHVISEDRSDSLTYTLRLFAQPSANADLLAIRADGVLLDGFAAGVYTYELTIPSESPKRHLPILPDFTFETADSMQAVEVELSPLGQPTYITVTAADGNSQQQYQINTAASLSSYALLDAIAVNGVLLTDFAPSQMNYTVNVLTLGNVTVNYHRGDYYQTVEKTIEGNVVTLTVTAEDGTTAAYTITLIAPLPSSDASLREIKLNGSLLPGFSSSTTAYQDTLEKGASWPDISVVPNDANAYTQLLISGDTATIHVTAEDGVSTMDYQIIFLQKRSSEAHLEMIFLNEEALPLFNPDQLVYQVDIPVGGTRPEITWAQKEPIQQVVLTVEGLTSIITVMAEDSTTLVYQIQFTQLLSSVDTLQMIYEDGMPLSGFSALQYQYAIDLPVGTRMFPELSYEPGDAYQTIQTDTLLNDQWQQQVRFTVTAETGSQKTYTVAYTILRSDVDILQAIWLDNEPFADFSGTQNKYTVSLPYGTQTMPTVDWIQGDAYQTVDSVWMGNTLVITVTAEMGNVRNYMLQFTIARSTNPYLSLIEVDGSTLAGFYPQQLEYQYALPFGTTTMPSVSWTTGDEQQTVDTTWTDNTLTIHVTAGDSISTADYHLTFNILPSTNAQLSMIFIGGEEADGFAPERYDYTDTLAYGVNELPEVTWLTADEQQTVEMTIADHLVTLLVTAGDGITTEEYEITFISLLSPNNYLADLQANGTTIEGFHPDSITYEITYPVGSDASVFLTAADITATPQDADAQVLVTDDADHTITIMVTAPNGDRRVYVITQTILLSTEARLEMIYLDSVALKGFDPDVFEYEVILSPGSVMPEVTAVPLDERAEVAYGLFEDIVGEAYEGKTIELDGVAENGDRLTYTITFRYAEWSATAECDSDDYLFLHVPGSDEFKIVSISIGLRVGVYDLNGHLLFMGEIPVAQPADVEVEIESSGNQVLKSASPNADGAVFKAPQTNVPYFYVVFNTKNKRVAKGGKFMLIN